MGQLGNNIAIALMIAILAGGFWLVQINQKRPVPKPLQDMQLKIAESLCPPSDDICDVLLEKLLEFPGAFNDILIRTEGILWLQFEGNSLYLNERSYASHDHRNAIWVSVESSLYRSLNGQHVVVEGRFFGGRPHDEYFGGYGHGSLWYGEIEVVAIEPKANKALQLTLDSAAELRR